ncbi:MAG: pilus (MSHA type) biogenesis protein MshL [Gammaproteobacteria bacterium]|nr:pilus (MSHA type) biogenesis protein MshL [Gammaproteobacteria bacterium]
MNEKTFTTRPLFTILTSALLVSCSLTPSPEKSDEVHQVFSEEQQKQETQTKPQAPLVVPDSVSADLMGIGGVSLETAALEERFNVAANGVPLKPFLQSMVSESPYSVAFHPSVTANVSLDLKDVTIAEVIEVLNSLYAVDIQFRGKVLQVFPADIKTETLDINYLMLKRFGMTSTNISSGGLVNGQNGGSGGNSGSNRSSGSMSNSGSFGNSMGGGLGNSMGMMGGMGSGNGSNIQTSSESDYWKELEDTLKMIMKSTPEDTSRVVVSPQSGLVTVRGLPSDIQAVKDFIKRSEQNLLRQVILEAKIVEVTLDDDYQQGINWQNVVSNSGDTSFNFNTTGGVFGNQLTSTLGGISSLSFNNVDFSGVVNLLKTQGNVQVLSAPRVTATNNQKAVLKAGEDEYFVTDVSTTTVTGTATTSTPDISLEPFFSGIALDVTPQISENGEVVLHVHPSVTEIAEQQKVITLNEEQYVLPLAQSNIRESDTVIKAKSGEIVVIGGLMQTSTTNTESRVPFLGAIPVLGNLFKSKQDVETKKELVILIKPTIVGTGTWQEQMKRSAELLQRWYGD